MSTRPINNWQREIVKSDGTSVDWTAIGGTVADGSNVALGAKADAAATTDAGTFSLIALIKRLLQKLTTGLGLTAGEAHIGQVGGHTGVIVPTITVSTSPAYSSGDCVGGKLTLSSIVRTAGGTALVQSLFLRDTSNQKAALELLIFNADPTSSTLTDNAAAVIHANDIDKIVRRISIAASDYVTIDSKAWTDLSVGGKPIKPASGSDMYAALITTGTPTYAATTAIGLRLGVLQD